MTVADCRPDVSLLESGGPFAESVDHQHRRADNIRARIGTTYSVGQKHGAEAFALPGLSNRPTNQLAGAVTLAHIFQGSHKPFGDGQP
jgi:hypothetical protein